MLRIFLLLVILATPAFAHRQNESYVYLNVGADSLNGRIEIALDDLGRLMAIDDNSDGAISRSEFDIHAETVYTFFRSRLGFELNGQRFPVKISNHDFLELGFGTYAEIAFLTDITEALPDTVMVEYTSYFERLDPGHRVLLLIESNERIGLEGNESNHTLVFSSGKDRQQLSLVGAPWYAVSWTFLKHGVVHILIGYDHIAFLFTLLLSSVLLVSRGRFRPVPRFRDGLVNVLKIATVFTVAHSVTLSLAALGYVRFPEQIIESLIAVSVIIVALNNLFVFKRRWVWVAVFLLGLVHGLGFANVLAPLGVASSSMVWSLLAFNVGVELGQAAIIAVCFPVLFALRGTRIYVPLVLRGGSVVLLAVAALWFVERAFQVNVPVVPWLASWLS